MRERYRRLCCVRPRYLKRSGRSLSQLCFVRIARDEPRRVRRPHTVPPALGLPLPCRTCRTRLGAPRPRAQPPPRLAANGPSPVLPSAAAAQPSGAAAQFFFFFSLARKTGGLLTRGLVPKTLLLRLGTSICIMGETTKKLMTQKRTW